MQVTIDAKVLKSFTRELTCISKYGDEMVIHAGAEGLVLSALNLAKTAYCSFTYRKSFFQRYTAPRSTPANTAGTSRTSDHASSAEGGTGLKWMLQTKPLLSILKHRNTDKTAEKCELTIIDGGATPEDELRDDEDSFESRLIVRLHCKYGIVKTHRLLLNTPSSDEAPLIPTSEDESRIFVQARAVKEVIDHFPGSKGQKSDPELIWRFDEDEVHVKSMERGIDAKGKSQLATELTLGADEFDYYHVPTAPLVLGFFLREFNATISLADALNIPIDFRFTTSVQPICISADADGCNMLFIIATNPAHGQESVLHDAQLRKSQTNGRVNGSHRSASGVPVPQKRALEDNADDGGSARSRTAAPDVVRNGRQSQRTRTVSAQDAAVNFHAGENDYDVYGAGPEQSQPLFLATQLSAVEVETIRESGLGIENMDAEEFAAMLDDEGEEVGIDTMRVAPTSSGTDGTKSRLESGTRDESEYDELDEDVDMGATQLEAGTTISSEKTFRPLFED